MSITAASPIADRLTDRSNLAIARARVEALRHRCAQVGSDHLLLGILLVSENSVAITAINNLGVVVQTIQQYVDENFKDTVGGEALFTTWAYNRAIARAAKQASDFGHPYIGVEHILLGIIEEQDLSETGALVALEKCGLTPAAIRAEVFSLLGMIPTKPKKSRKKTLTIELTPRQAQLVVEDMQRTAEAGDGTTSDDDIREAKQVIRVILEARANVKRRLKHQICDGNGTRSWTGDGGETMAKLPCPGCIKCKPWGTQEWKRTGGDCLCSCGVEHFWHQIEQGPGYGFASDEILSLWRLCDGSLVKL